jgi:hypothetical protein
MRVTALTDGRRSRKRRKKKDKDNNLLNSIDPKSKINRQEKENLKYN